jgi:hypothetical protein
MHFLTEDQVEDLALAITLPNIRPAGHGAGPHWRTELPEYGLLVRFAAYTGLRAGKLGALRVWQARSASPPGRGERSYERSERPVGVRSDGRPRKAGLCHCLGSCATSWFLFWGGGGGRTSYFRALRVVHVATVTSMLATSSRLCDKLVCPTR